MEINNAKDCLIIPNIIDTETEANMQVWEKIREKRKSSLISHKDLPTGFSFYYVTLPGLTIQQYRYLGELPEQYGWEREYSGIFLCMPEKIVVVLTDEELRKILMQECITYDKATQRVINLCESIIKNLKAI